MSKIDNLTKNYIRNPEKFADLFNTFVFDGNQIIVPESLQERDSTEIMIDTVRKISIQKARDGLKLLKAMDDGNSLLLLLGVENQNLVHYAMPVRAMVYDSANYSTQVASYKQEIEQNKEQYSNAEYISRFPRNGKIIPVITIVLYWNPNEWTGPKRLHDMFDKATVDKYGKYINDYRLNLVCPFDATESQISNLKTDLREVMQFIKYSKEKSKLNTIIEDNAERFSKMASETAALIKAVSGSKIKLKVDEGGNVNMCKAIEDMRMESKMEGAAEKEKEDIKAAYQLVKELSPGMKDKDVIRKLSETFKKTQKAIRAIVL